MNELRLLERAIGGRWTGIVFRDGLNPKGNLPQKPMRLCEAIKESCRSPIVLTKELISCPGALRSLGWSTNDDNMIAKEMAETTGANIDVIRELVTSTPRLEEAPYITVGNEQRVDIAVSYAQPVAAMRLVRQWQLTHGTDLDIAASTIMSVCGSVVARTYTTGQICMSFGCPDSRKHGGIGRDQLIIGVPVRLIENIF